MFNGYQIDLRSGEESQGEDGGADAVGDDDRAAIFEEYAFLVFVISPMRQVCEWDAKKRYLAAVRVAGEQELGRRAVLFQIPRVMGYINRKRRGVFHCLGTIGFAIPGFISTGDGDLGFANGNFPVLIDQRRDPRGAHRIFHACGPGFHVMISQDAEFPQGCLDLGHFREARRGILAVAIDVIAAQKHDIGLQRIDLVDHLAQSRRFKIIAAMSVGDKNNFFARKFRRQIAARNRRWHDLHPVSLKMRVNQKNNRERDQPQNYFLKLFCHVELKISELNWE